MIPFLRRLWLVTTLAAVGMLLTPCAMRHKSTPPQGDDVPEYVGPPSPEKPDARPLPAR